MLHTNALPPSTFLEEWKPSNQIQTLKTASKSSYMPLQTSPTGAANNLPKTSTFSCNTTNNGSKQVTNSPRTKTSLATGAYPHTYFGTTLTSQSPCHNTLKPLNISTQARILKPWREKCGETSQFGNTLPSTTSMMNAHLSPNVFGTTHTNTPNNVKATTDQDMTTTTMIQKPTSPPNNLIPTQTSMVIPNLHEDGNSRSLPTSTSPTCPKAIDSSAKQKHSLTVYSHNVQGLKGEEKLEWITRIMDSKNLDAYIIQETHLLGDYTTTLPKGNILIHHGPETQPTRGAKGGVGIILSKDLVYLGIKSQSKIIHGETLIGIHVRVDNLV